MRRGIKPLLPAATATHNKGGHLDQMLTNIESGTIHLHEAPMSDHSFLRASLVFTPTPADVDVRRMPKTVSMRDTRKTASSTATLNKLLSDSWSIADEDTFASEIYQRPVI